MKITSLARVFGVVCALTVFGILSHFHPEAGVGLAFIGLVAGMKQKGLTLTKEQEDFINELDESIAKSLTAQKTITDEQKKTIDDLKELVKSMKDLSEKDKKQWQDDFDALQAKYKDQASATAKTKSFEVEIEEKLNGKKSDWLNDQGTRKSNFNTEFILDRKAVGDMSSSGNITGSYFVAPDVRPGVVLKPYNSVHMRDIMVQGRTSSNVIRHVRDLGGEGGPAMVAEGGTKPQLDRDLSIVDAPVRKLATHLRVPEEMVEDIPYLTSFLTNMGTEEVMAVEDTQILYGDGTGQNLSGLFTNATAWAATAAMKIPDPNRYDVLRAAKRQMKVLKRNPTYALVSPTDYYLLTSKKDTTNNYILLGGGNGILPNIDGVPIYEMNQIADGDFLLMDRNCAEIDFRENVRVRLYDQDRDNPIKNLVTIVIEERLALPIYYVDGLIKGVFSTAITALTPA